MLFMIYKRAHLLSTFWLSPRNTTDRHLRFLTAHTLKRWNLSVLWFSISCSNKINLMSMRICYKSRRNNRNIDSVFICHRTIALIMFICMGFYFQLFNGNTICSCMDGSWRMWTKWLKSLSVKNEIYFTHLFQIYVFHK